MEPINFNPSSCPPPPRSLIGIEISGVPINFIGTGAKHRHAVNVEPFQHSEGHPEDCIDLSRSHKANLAKVDRMVDGQKSSPTIDGGLRKCDAPIQRLSFDVLSQIFLECLPDFPSLPSVASGEAPVLLGRICSHWRTVAFNTHLLWAGISLGSGRSQADYRKDILAAVEWKIRAGSCLLSYCLSRTPVGVLDVILLNCSQWRHLEVDLKIDGWNRVYAAISQGRVPHLQYLDIHILTRSFNTRGPFRDNVQIDIPFPGVPQLQSLFTRMNFKLHFCQMKSPSLRKLIFDHHTLSLDDCWSCLRYCPNLEHFSAICDEGNPFTFSPEIIEATALKHFQLIIEEAGFDRLLNVIHARSLETLKVEFYHHSLPRLSRFLEISGAHLLSMNIKAPMTSDQIIECLHYTPVLASLELRRALLNDAIIEALTLGPGLTISHDNICTKLQRIVLVKAPLMSLDIMKNMILSRWRGVEGTMMLSNGGPDSNWERNLRSILLDGLEFGDDRVITEDDIIMRCIEEGLEVTEQLPLHRLMTR